MRMGPAPRAQRKAEEGPIGMTPRPSRNSGARVTGLYDIPANTWVGIGNSRYEPPRWIGEPGDRFLTWGGRFFGTGTTSDPTNQFKRGATLWTLDEDDNPVPLDHEEMPTIRGGGGGSSYFALGSNLGANGDAVTEIVPWATNNCIRWLPYGPFPGPYIITVPNYAIKSARVEGNALVASDQYTFTFVTDTEPVGTWIPYGLFGGQAMELADPDFVFEATGLTVAGLSHDRALIFAGVDRQAEFAYPTLGVWAFDPFDLEGTLGDPDYPGIVRQPDHLYDWNDDFGILVDPDDFYSGINPAAWYVGRRTDSEAVMVIGSTSTPGASVPSQMNVVRFSDTGAVLGNEVRSWTDSQDPDLNPYPHPMAEQIAHAGNLRIDASSSLLDLPTPILSSAGRTSPTLPVDAERYMYIRHNALTNPDRLLFVYRDLLTNQDLRVVTSYADVDAEVAAMTEMLSGGYAGVVDENLLVTWRQAGAYYARNNVVIIELGAGRQAGTAQVITEDRRFHRLPQGLS
jgi:hypothetical protein